MKRIVPLGSDEALVLLNWLSRHDGVQYLPPDDAEVRALWKLESTFSHPDAA